MNARKVVGVLRGSSDEQYNDLGQAVKSAKTVISFALKKMRGKDARYMHLVNCRDTVWPCRYRVCSRVLSTNRQAGRLHHWPAL